MSEDSFTEVSEQGLGQNLLESIKGVAVGGLLFLASFVVLWWNEGRTDPSVIARKAVVVESSSVNAKTEGKLIAATGALQSDEKLADPEFLLPGAYLRVYRQAEMFAWVEESSSKTEKKLGGGKRTETTYSYKREWTSRPGNHRDFKEPRGHENPGMPVSNDSFSVKQARLGAYRLAPEKANLGGDEQLRLSKDIIVPAALGADAKADPAPAAGEAPDAAPAAQEAAEDEPVKKVKRGKRRHGRRLRTAAPVAHQEQAGRRAAALEARRPPGYVLAGDRYLFRGVGSLEQPRIGDVRVSFRVVRGGQPVLFLGQQQGAEIIAFHKDDVTLFRAFHTQSLPDAVQQLATEHKMITWIMRLVGWLMMWFGLSLFFGPINAVLDIIPFLGSAGRFLVGLVMLPLSVMLSVIVILVSIVAHSPILLVLTFAGLGAGGYFLYQKKKKKAA